MFELQVKTCFIDYLGFIGYNTYYYKFELLIGFIHFIRASLNGVVIVKQEWGPPRFQVILTSILKNKCTRSIGLQSTEW